MILNTKNNTPKWYGVMTCKDPLKALSDTFPELLDDDPELLWACTQVRLANKKLHTMIKERFEDSKKKVGGFDG